MPDEFQRDIDPQSESVQGYRHSAIKLKFKKVRTSGGTSKSNMKTVRCPDSRLKAGEREGKPISAKFESPSS